MAGPATPAQAAAPFDLNNIIGAGLARLVGGQSNAASSSSSAAVTVNPAITVIQGGGTASPSTSGGATASPMASASAQPAASYPYLGAYGPYAGRSVQAETDLLQAGIGSRATQATILGLPVELVMIGVGLLAFFAISGGK